MDPVAVLLHGIRARQAVLHHTVLEPPWALRIEERYPLTLAAVLQGECWVSFDDGERALLRPGDIGLIVGQDCYTVADDPGTPVGVVVRRDGAWTVAGERLPTPVDAVTCVLGQSGHTLVVSGSFDVRSVRSGRLLQALPRVTSARLPHGSALFAFLLGELGVVRPGRQEALDRWLDLALATTVRAWLETSDQAPGWYVALGDPAVGPALRALHDDLAAGWTVASLARSAGLSRSAFAQRFTQVVGQTPLAYLTQARLEWAAELLQDPTATVAAVARRVGYATPYGLSAAFKRHFGVPPTRFAA
jgi:AraC-like DNA-binding protein